MIQKARRHQDWIKFHVNPNVSGIDNSAKKREFLSWVDSILPNDKAQIFRSFFRPPYATNDIAGTIFDALFKIFNSRNPSFNYQFSKKEYVDDWEEYRIEKLGEPAVWENDGWKNFKSEINSILVVDLPAVQTTEFPEPYFYWLSIENLIAFKSCNDLECTFEWIAFYVIDGEDKKIAFYDKNSFRLFSEKDGNIENLISESVHNLGYCPARFFWNEPISVEHPFLKLHPLSKLLSKLDDYLFHFSSKKHLELYAAYPIYSGYEINCDYYANSERCSRGFLVGDSGVFLMDTEKKPKRCQICSPKRLAGAGNYLEIPIPKDGVDLRNPVSLLGVDRASLDFHTSESKRLEKEIIESACGLNSEIVNDVAINQRQVESLSESRNTVLNRVKKGFESAQTWVSKTIARLRYGDNFLSLSINYGTDYFDLTVEQLRSQLVSARGSGASESELQSIRVQIIDTEFKNDQIKKQRMLILLDIEPFVGFDRSEVLNLHRTGIIDEIELIVKLNFVSFIDRFEREVMNIIEYMSFDDYSTKINSIKEKLNEYANERRKTREVQSA